VLYASTGSCNEDVTVTDYGVFYWPRTTFSQRAELDCPYGGLAPSPGSATAYRWCHVSDDGYFVEWTQPVYDDCSTVNSLIVCSNARLY